MKRLKLALVVLLAHVAVFSYAGQIDEGIRAADAGDYKTAVKVWRPLAEQGDAKAQFNLGVAYHKGQGVPDDFASSPFRNESSG